MLPEMIYNPNVSRNTQSQFGGLDLRRGSGNGTICDMENMSGAEYPLMESRKARMISETLHANPNGIFSAGHLYEAAGTKLYADGQLVSSVMEDGEKTFCALGERVVIFPDKILVKPDGDSFSVESLEASISKTGMKFGNGTYAGESAELNSITITSGTFPFRVGDAVTISGCTVDGNNKTPIIREISDDKRTLRFYENTFVEAKTESGTVTIERKVPDMEFLTQNENRIWGCGGDTIWCCKLGDPFNWFVFDGVSTDAWSVETGSAGEFTGCCSYLGYPIFFKEDKIFKVYGSRPNNFEVMSSATFGVEKGSNKSIAVAGETLFYLTRSGFASYSGGVPALISDVLGEKNYRDAVAGSDGTNYYVSAINEVGYTELLVFNTDTKAWHREDDLRPISMAYHDGVLYAQSDDGKLVALTRDHDPDGFTMETAFDSMAEFGDFDYVSFFAEYPVRIRLRGEVYGSLTIQIMYDSTGVWENVNQIVSETRKQTYYFPLPIRRCDHYRLRFLGHGQWRLYAMETEYLTENYPRK